VSLKPPLLALHIGVRYALRVRQHRRKREVRCPSINYIYMCSMLIDIQRTKEAEKKKRALQSKVANCSTLNILESSLCAQCYPDLTYIPVN
jgi:hypothetical protein